MAINSRKKTESCVGKESNVEACLLRAFRNKLECLSSQNDDVIIRGMVEALKLYTGRGEGNGEVGKEAVNAKRELNLHPLWWEVHM